MSKTRFRRRYACVRLYDRRARYVRNTPGTINPIYCRPRTDHDRTDHDRTAMVLWASSGAPEK